MNSIARIFLFLIALVLIIECENSDILRKHFKIPEEDRYIFTTGDTLIYRCSDGSFDSVLVKEVKFWTENGTSENWFGNKTRYSADNCQITVEHFNDNWNNILVGAEAVYDSIIVYNRCFTILGSASSYLDDPYTDVANSCSGYLGLVVAMSNVDFSILNLNDRDYQKIYHDASMDYEIYWNLKFGIIRIIGKNENSDLLWDLEVHTPA